MSKGYRNGAFALGIVVGGGISLNLFLWLDYRSKKIGNNPTNAEYSNDYSQIGTYWDGFFGTFVSPSDTLAQWIMALLTIVAVGLLWQTLRQTDSTNRAAVAAAKAAADSNDLMRQDQRPWIQFEILDFGLRYGQEGDGGTFPWFAPKVKFKNWGRSPAFFVTLDIKTEFSDGFNMGSVDKFLTDREENTIAFPTTVFPGSEVTLDNVGTSISDAPSLRPGDEITPSMAYLMVVATYRNGERQFVTTKVFMVHVTGLIGLQNPEKFSPMHLMPFDRYE